MLNDQNLADQRPVLSVVLPRGFLVFLRVCVVSYSNIHGYYIHYEQLAVNKINGYKSNKSVCEISMLCTGNQLAAARALVGIDQVTLAKAAKVSVTTIRNLESSGQGPLSGRADTVRRIQNALEQLNIEFLNGGQPGVRLRKGPIGDPASSIPVEKLTSENDE